MNLFSPVKPFITVYVYACAAGVPIIAVTNIITSASAELERWCCPVLVIKPLSRCLMMPLAFGTL